MVSSKVVLFLQNAWSPVYAGRIWPRASWLRALARSRSGQRLRILVDCLECVENTTPIVGESPDSIVAPDSGYIAAIIRARQPSVIVACGTQARLALVYAWSGPLLALPHPANRILTNGLYSYARNLLAVGLTKRVWVRPIKSNRVSQWVEMPIEEVPSGQ